MPVAQETQFYELSYVKDACVVPFVVQRMKVLTTENTEDTEESLRPNF